MPYCLPADVLLFAPQSADHSDDVAAHIDQAEVTVNSYLRQVFTVPFADGAVDPVVEQLTARLAAGRWLRATHQRVNNSDLMEHGRRLEDEAMQDLRDLVANPSRIADVARPDASDYATVKVAGGTPVFDLGDPIGWGTP